MQWESERLAIETLSEDNGGWVAIEEPGFDVGCPLGRAVLGGDGGFLGGPRRSEARDTNDPRAVLICGEEEGGELGGRGGDGWGDWRRGRGRGGARRGAIGTMVGPILKVVDASIRVRRLSERRYGPV